MSENENEEEEKKDEDDEENSEEECDEGKALWYCMADHRNMIVIMTCWVSFCKRGIN